MDEYALHTTEEVNEKLKEMRANVCIIPGGLTSILQPLDVGIFHVIK